jgi:uncharacterized membrane protein
VSETDAERADRHRFTGRLEAFSDIVFGFALAQSAFALQIPATLDAVYAQLSNLVFFAITFALIGAFWMMHYRIFHYAFAAQRVDVVLNFMLLAVVALLPYVLRLYLKFPESEIASAAYSAELGLGFSLLAALEYRGLRLLGPSIAPKPLRSMRRALVRHAVPGVVFLAALALFVPLGLSARYAWAAAPIGIAIVRSIDRARDRAAAGTSATVIES